ncbi:putative baseplate assembly protein [Poseidonocella pacifica]|uniref:Putative baseplate assembly protein n=1 Tax=Poseidonocella pacifica TaxID=871651 RepID=A0A1I0VR52_9RHOB|nr:hypothetical protein [Poseidonocella pacifica]SFA78507.1 putative baseplate assembly protein [Poseidonocella pacifica]
MSCEHDCHATPPFPAGIYNRPGLDRIGYRIGDYARFREHALSRLDAMQVLSEWTHRGADDPGIAVLECGAIATEILAFYQELYANEVYLRTADWRESVARLVALTGYRLAPGLGGEATFALAVSGDTSVTVPAGFPFKADLDGANSPARFETTEEITAYPWLNQFSLYRPRNGPAAIAAGARVLELQAVDGDTALSKRQAQVFNPGDRIMLVPDSTMFEAGGGANPVQERSETLVIDRVEQVLDRIRLHFRGAVTLDRGPTVRAYRIGRSFRHFGHNAPLRIAALNETTGRATFDATVFNRVAATTTHLYSQFADNEIALESDVTDLPAGSGMIVTGAAEFAGAGETEFAVVNAVDTVRNEASHWAGLSGGNTAVALNANLFTNANLSLTALDVRRLQAHEVRSPPLLLAAAHTFSDGDFGLDTTLTFFGRHDRVQALAGRALLLEDEDGQTQRVNVTNVAEDFDLAGRDPEEDWLWTLALDQPPRFPQEAFAETDARVVVHGNLALADQGETQKEAAIGSGDARQTFQTFKLPKAPLTYLLHPGQTPPHVPELEVRVDGILWTRVDTFFASGANDRVYVVRQDDDGNSLVQFGDGITGARLSSGRRNVTVRFRTGQAARGPLEKGKSPKAMGRLAQLNNVAMPAPAVNGADPETEDTARQAAPMRMQSLGRLVGLSDYEAEALSLPGVQRAAAAFALSGGLLRLRVTVLTDGGGAAEAAAAAEALSAADRCRGAMRYPLEVVQGLRRWIFLDLTAGYRADRLPEDIQPAIHAVLGCASGTTEPQDGLFGFGLRRFGQDTHVSQVIAAVQQIDGVAWVRVDAFQPIPQGTPPQTDPLALPVPAPAVRETSVGCDTQGLLALHETHLRLSFALVTGAEECS